MALINTLSCQLLVNRYGFQGINMRLAMSSIPKIGQNSSYKLSTSEETSHVLKSKTSI